MFRVLSVDFHFAPEVSWPHKQFSLVHHLLSVYSALRMQRASGEQVPCLSAAESNGLLLDHSHDSEPAHTGSSQARDEFSDMVPCSSHRYNLHHLVLSGGSTGINSVDDNAVSQPPGSSKPIPRVLSFSWSSFLTDAVYILSTIPFIVLACLLAGANVKPVDQASDQNFGNGTRVVSLPYLARFI